MFSVEDAEPLIIDLVSNILLYPFEVAKSNIQLLPTSHLYIHTFGKTNINSSNISTIIYRNAGLSQFFSGIIPYAFNHISMKIFRVGWATFLREAGLIFNVNSFKFIFSVEAGCSFIQIIFHAIETLMTCLCIEIYGKKKISYDEGMFYVFKEKVWTF